MLRVRVLTLVCNDSADNVARLVEVDDFIAELWKVHQAVKKEGYVQVDTYTCTHPSSII